MADYYLNVVTGNNRVAAVAGYDLTSATKTVTKAGSFANYVYHAGDQFRVADTGDGGHAVIAYYTIASRVGDNSITLTADPTDGTDETNVLCDFGCDGTTEATSVGTHNGPWKDPFHAYDSMSNADRIYIKASGDYTYQDGASGAIIEADENANANDQRHFEGYHTTVGDGGIVTFDADAGTLTNCLLMNAPGADMYHHFRNFRFTGASADGVEAYGKNKSWFYNCMFDNNDGNGVDVNGWNSFVNCLAENNGTNGFRANNYYHGIGLISRGNSQDGIEGGFPIPLFGSIIYNNGDGYDAVISDTYTYGSTYLNVSIDKDNQTTGVNRGIRENNQDIATIMMNTILFDCEIGISGAKSGDAVYSKFTDFNLFYSNDTDRNNYVAGPNDIAGSSDPFTASATRDYTLKSGSEALAAGYDGAWAFTFWTDYNAGAGNNPPTGGSSYTDLGAMQQECTGGGSGGLLSSNKRGNKL